MATWEAWVDAARYPQWQALVLTVRDLSGPVSSVGTTFVLDYGPKMRRTVRVVAAEPPRRHVTEQQGMGQRDLLTATFEPDHGGTRLTVVQHAHFDPIMGILARLSRSRAGRELQGELDRFTAVVGRATPPAVAGRAYDVLAGAYRRRVVVTAVQRAGSHAQTGGDGGRVRPTDQLVHIRLEPGWSRADAASTAPPAPAPDFPSDFRLWPISSPLRSSVASGNDGLPWLLRDGGHGVEHLVLGRRAWADAQPVEAGEVPVTDRDRAALDAWRIDEDPIVGVDATMDLAPLVTLRLGVDAQGTEVWGAAKVLRSEVLRVHLLIYGATWPSRPDTIEPTVTRLGRMSDEAMERGDPPDLSHGVGHVPLQRLAFDKAEPRFAGLTTMVDGELDGYRYWREAKGGTFDTLQWIVDWDPAAHRPLEVPAIRWLDDPPDGRP